MFSDIGTVSNDDVLSLLYKRICILVDCVIRHTAHRYSLFRAYRPTRKREL